MLNPEQINEGRRLEEKVQEEPWSVLRNNALKAWLSNHAKELLNAAEECERLRKEVDSARVEERMRIISILKKKLCKEDESLDFISEIINEL